MILVLRSKTVQSCFLSDKTVKALDLDFSTAGFVQMMNLDQSKRGLTLPPPTRLGSPPVGLAWR